MPGTFWIGAYRRTRSRPRRDTVTMCAAWRFWCRSTSSQCCSCPPSSASTCKPATTRICDSRRSCLHDAPCLHEFSLKPYRLYGRDVTTSAGSCGVRDDVIPWIQRAVKAFMITSTNTWYVDMKSVGGCQLVRPQLRRNHCLVGDATPIPVPILQHDATQQHAARRGILTRSAE
jgi:hypothetical protein